MDSSNEDSELKNYQKKRLFVERPNKQTSRIIYSMSTFQLKMIPNITTV